MSCLKNELDNLKNEVKAHEELLKTLRKHPKILKIQELDVFIRNKYNLLLQIYESLKLKQILKKLKDFKTYS